MVKACTDSLSAQPIEAKVNTATALPKTRWAPKRSANQPLTGMKAAKVIK